MPSVGSGRHGRAYQDDIKWMREEAGRQPEALFPICQPIAETDGQVHGGNTVLISPTCANFLLVEEEWIANLSNWVKGCYLIYVYEDAHTGGMPMSMQVVGMNGRALRIFIVDIHVEVGLMKDDYMRLELTV